MIAPVPTNVPGPILTRPDTIAPGAIVVKSPISASCPTMQPT
jgi:hypothetical protein